MDCRSKVASSTLAVNAVHFGNFTEAARHSSSDAKHEQHLTGVAQGQRAWLITTRSYDQNVSPVSITIRQLYRSCHTPSLPEEGVGGGVRGETQCLVNHRVPGP